MELHKIGINCKNNSEKKSNKKLAPKSILISKYATKIWELLIFFKVNKAIPNKIKQIIKKQIYYGGKTINITEYEKKILCDHLKNTL